MRHGQIDCDDGLFLDDNQKDIFIDKNHKAVSTDTPFGEKRVQFNSVVYFIFQAIRHQTRSQSA